MPRTPVVIRVSRLFAGFLAAAIGALSTAGILITWSEDRSIIVRLIYTLLPLFGLGFSAATIRSLFSPWFIYDPHSRPEEAGAPEIACTGDTITVRDPANGEMQEMRWEDINCIRVLTTAEGPAVCDVFFVLYAPDDEPVYIPQDHKAAAAVLDRMMAFPGFDFQAFTEAMSSADHRWFTVWEQRSATQ